jgi:hypothetical protein
LDIVLDSAEEDVFDGEEGDGAATAVASMEDAVRLETVLETESKRTSKEEGSDMVVVVSLVVEEEAVSSTAVNKSREWSPMATPPVTSKVDTAKEPTVSYLPRQKIKC